MNAQRRARILLGAATLSSCITIANDAEQLALLPLERSALARVGLRGVDGLAAAAAAPPRRATAAPTAPAGGSDAGAAAPGGANVGQLPNQSAVERDRVDVVVANVKKTSRPSALNVGLLSTSNVCVSRRTRPSPDRRDTGRRRCSRRFVRPSGDGRPLSSSGATESICASVTRSGLAPGTARTRNGFDGRRQSEPGSSQLK